MVETVMPLRYKDKIYDTYNISRDGKIFNKKMNKEIKQSKGSGDRILVYINDNKPHTKPIKARVDELLINSFYPNVCIYGRKDLKITYKDGDYKNLNIDNLTVEKRPSYKTREEKIDRINVIKKELEETGEDWKGIITPDRIDISDYYMVSTKGRVYSKKRGTIISSIVKSKDKQYNKCLISIKELNLHKQYLIGRLVASTFIGIPDKNKFVRHRNGNTLDDSLENICYT